MFQIVKGGYRFGDNDNNSDTGEYGGYGGNGGGSGSRTSASAFLVKHRYKLTSRDKEFIKKNEWIIPYLEEFIKDCNGTSDPGRPNLGLIGNAIRSFIAYDESKEMFEHYWLGKGEWKISYQKWRDIVSTLPEKKDWIYLRTEGNKKVWNVGMDFRSDKYGMLGTFTLYTDLTDYPMGLYDYINFDWKLGRLVESSDRSGRTYEVFSTAGACGFSTGRSFKNEWVTRAVNVASLTSRYAKPYIFMYP